jgi:hypothetical protein
MLHYKISSWRHIYLNLRELGGLESYVIHHLETNDKYQRVNSTPWCMRNNSFLEETTTYTSG